MIYCDLSLPAPAENLACDEALLEECETRGGPEMLRVWESATHFAVVGYANRISSEVNVAACEAKGIPVFRRCSGGGTVVQGPGCLNYALVLRTDESGPLAGIHSANCFIMERNRAAVQRLLSQSNSRHARSTIQIRGHTDLVVDGLKFSGNAQRRKKRCLLFHGSFLLTFNLTLIEELLPLPSHQPEYRRNRRHIDFLTNLDLPAADVKSALRQVWNADQSLDNVPLDRIATLALDKYATREWNWKF
jgi:lipoate---protein ligase